MRTDPITTEVVRHGLETIAEEMGTALRRTALSVVVKDMRDYSCALFDPRGRLLAAAIDIPTLIASMSPALQACIRKWGDEIHDGDVFMSNHPYMGAAQTNDVNVFVPVFLGDVLIGYTGAVAHHADWGGRVPGTASFANRSSFEEGVMLPGVKVEEAGIPNRTVHDIMVANVRHPKQNEGDLRAQIAACRSGARRFRSMAERYGLETLVTTVEDLIGYTADRTRQEIATWPDGDYAAEGYIDNDGITMGAPVKFAVDIEIRGERIAFDFSRTDPQMVGGHNIPYTTTRSAVQYAVTCLLPQDIPFNEGALAQVDIHAPLGSAVNPIFPAAVGDRHIVSERLADVLTQALLPVRPDRTSAGWCVGFPVFNVGCRSPKTGDGVHFLANIGGGAGAAAGNDGADAVDVHLSNCALVPAEVVESSYPLRVERFDLVRDSGGAGEFRGGLGMRADYRNLSGEVLKFQSEVEQADPRFPPAGVEGGLPGGICAVRTTDAAGTELELPSKGMFEIPDQQVISLISGGGGGYGDPRRRPVAAVLADVVSGRISAEAALDFYGVDVATGVRRGADMPAAG